MGMKIIRDLAICTAVIYGLLLLTADMWEKGEAYDRAQRIDVMPSYERIIPGGDVSDLTFYDDECIEGCLHCEAREACRDD